MHRIEIENALRSSEARYKAIFENSGSALIIVDENDVISMANMRFEKLAGISKEEIEGKIKWRRFVVNEKDYYELSGYKKMRVTNSYTAPYSFEFQFIDALGNKKDALAMIALMPGTKQALAALFDMTERNQAVRELEYQYALLSNQQEASVDGILVVDENGKILSFNKRFVEIWNIPEDVLATKSDDAAIKAVLTRLNDPDLFIKTVNEIYREKNRSSFNELLMKDGRILERYSAPVIGAAGKYFGRVWYFRDITERKETEAALKASEEKFSKAFRYAADVIGIVRDSDQKFIEVNDAFYSIFGYMQSEVIGYSSYEFGLWDNNEQRNALYKGFTVQPNCRNMEVKWRCKVG